MGLSLTAIEQSINSPEIILSNCHCKNNDDIDVFNKMLIQVMHKELEKPLDWKRLYDLSWLYALFQSIDLKEEELYNTMKRIVLDLLKDEKRYRTAIYNYYNATGLLFSLYHMAIRGEKDIDIYSIKVLNDIEKLRWHELDGEVMAFALILAHAINAEKILTRLNKELNNCINEWFENLNYRSLKNMIYVLFGLAYISDEKLVQVIRDLDLYQSSSSVLRKIINSTDVELIALTLYVFGKFVYNKKLRQLLGNEVKKEEVGNIIYRIRSEIIPKLSMILEKRIRETGLILDANSIPADLIVKIQFAKIETGLDKPFMLSKYEWKAYQEVSKSLRRGYYNVHKQHLVICLMLDIIFLPLIISMVLTLFVQDILGKTVTMLENRLFDFLLFVLLNFIYGINISLYEHGFIEKKYLLGLLKHIFIDIPRRVKKK